VPRLLLYGFPGAASSLFKRGYASRGLANIASPRKKTIPLNPDPTVEAAAWDAAAVKE
jgi:hypothetical protein